MAKRKDGAMPTSEDKRAFMQGVVESNIAEQFKIRGEHSVQARRVVRGPPNGLLEILAGEAFDVELALSDKVAPIFPQECRATMVLGGRPKVASMDAAPDGLQLIIDGLWVSGDDSLT